MSLSLKTKCLCYRPSYVVTRLYCDKSIYQRDEEGPKPRTVYGKLYPNWRKPWIQRDGEWKTKLSVFVTKNPNPDILGALSKIPTLNMQMVKDWWKEMKILQEIENQKYMKKRVAALGANLAAIHFFCFRDAKVRLRGSPRWLSGDAQTLNLPEHFEDGWFVEAIDCTDFHHNGIRYEGLQNLMNLNYLKWLCIKNSKYIDVWCLDRIAGQNGSSLEYLDISGCKLCPGGIIALSRMSALKLLVITDPGDDIDIQAALSILEQENPDLLIKVMDPVT